MTARLRPTEGERRRQAPEPRPEAIIQQTGASSRPGGGGDSRREVATRLLIDARTPEGQACARAFSGAAATHGRKLRERDPRPEPDRTPGAPHPDRFLAGRGWHVNQHGICTRRAEPEPQMPPKRELEAGL